jgi:hypothetical protein
MGKKKSHELFVKEMSEISPELTIIGRYAGAMTKIEVRDTLGIHYKVIPNSLLKGYMPALDTAIDKSDGFIKKSKSIHGDKYIYTKTVYIKNKFNVTITCPIHGDFIQSPGNHLAKHGCPKCAVASRSYSWSIWEKAGLSSIYFDSFKVYIIKCFDAEEEFFKIGKTFHTVASRFHGTKSTSHIPYNYEIIKIIEGPADFISKKEQELHNKYKDFKYTPKKDFKGKGECFLKIDL